MLSFIYGVSQSITMQVSPVRGLYLCQWVGLNIETLHHMQKYWFALAVARWVEMAIVTHLASGRSTLPKLGHCQRF